MEKSIRGRQHILAMFEGIMLTHPDFCCIPKSSRVVKELPMVIGAPLTGGVASSSGASSSSSGGSSGSIDRSSSSSSSRSAQCSSASDGVDEKMNSAETLCPEMTEGAGFELTGLPRCVLYKCFFTGIFPPSMPYTLPLVFITHPSNILILFSHEINFFFRSNSVNTQLFI